jgi:hypothetical protein
MRGALRLVPPLLAVALALPPRAVAQSASPARPALGALLGGAAGVLVGGTAGAFVGGNRCGEPANSDTCMLIEGIATGAAIGYTLGIPVGAHLLNRRRGDLRMSLAASAALAAAGYGVLRASGVRWNGGTTPRQRRVAAVVVVSVPVLQYLATTAIETATGRR